MSHRRFKILVVVQGDGLAEYQLGLLTARVEKSRSWSDDTHEYEARPADMTPLGDKLTRLARKVFHMFDLDHSGSLERSELFSKHGAHGNLDWGVPLPIFLSPSLSL